MTIVNVSLRVRIPASSKQSFAECPAMMESLATVAQNVLVRDPYHVLWTEQAVRKWEVFSQLRPDLAVRMQDLACRVWEEAQLTPTLTCPPILRWVAEAPTCSRRIPPPEEPFPFEISEEMIHEAYCSSEAFFDVLLTLSRLKVDPLLEERLMPETGAMHPEIEALWNNICLVLANEGVAGDFSQMLLAELEGMKIPLKKCLQDGLAPLTRLAELGVTQKLLENLLKAHPEGSNVIDFAQQSLLLLTMVRRGHWNVLKALRSRGWEGLWPDLAQRYGNVEPLLIERFVRLLDVGMEAEALIATPEDSVNSPVSIMLKFILEGSERLWDRFEIQLSLGEESIFSEWDRLWKRLSEEQQKKSIEYWLTQDEQVVQYLCHEERIAPLKWLLEEGKRWDIQMGQVCWPVDFKTLPAKMLQMLLPYRQYALGSIALKTVTKLDLMVGSQKEIFDFYAMLEGLGVSKNALEASFAEISPLPIQIVQELSGPHRRRIRAAFQIMEDATQNHTTISAKRIIELILLHTLRHRAPGHPLWLSQRPRPRPSALLSKPLMDSFRRAWHVPCSIEDGGEEWMSAHQQCLQQWSEESPLDLKLTKYFIQLWCDVLCVRVWNPPLEDMKLPNGEILSSDIPELLNDLYVFLFRPNSHEHNR